jgi:hypothetical protein
MKKRAIQFAFALFILSALFATSALFANQQEEATMKLVNNRTGFVVVEFKNGTPIFHDRFLEAEMNEKGIAIPSNHRAEFFGKDTIYPDDPQFQQAFSEIYVPLTIASYHYQWQD